MRYFVVAPVLEYLRPCGRVLTVYFAPSRLELAHFSLKCHTRKMHYFVFFVKCAISLLRRCSNTSALAGACQQYTSPLRA